jgi:hypothetical protein
MSQDLAAQLEQLQKSLGGGGGSAAGVGLQMSPPPMMNPSFQPTTVMTQSTPGSSLNVMMKKYGKYMIVFLLVAVGVGCYIMKKKLALKQTKAVPAGPSNNISTQRYQGPPPPGFGPPQQQQQQHPAASRLVPGSDDPNFTPLP